MGKYILLDFTWHFHMSAFKTRLRENKLFSCRNNGSGVKIELSSMLPVIVTQEIRLKITKKWTPRRFIWIYFKEIKKISKMKDVLKVPCKERHVWWSWNFDVNLNKVGRELVNLVLQNPIVKCCRIKWDNKNWRNLFHSLLLTFMKIAVHSIINSYHLTKKPITQKK